MSKKLLRRRVFCREADFLKKIRPKAPKCGYHRYTWAPISIDEIQKDVAWQILQGLDWKDSMFFSYRELRNIPYGFPTTNPPSNKATFGRQYIEYLRFSNRIYNKAWENWSWNFDDDHIYIRYFANRPWEIMGMATLERDY